MKEIILRQVVSSLLASVPPEVLIQQADRLIDVIEDMVAKSETKVDDAVVLPLIKLLRLSFSIPDND